MTFLGYERPDGSYGARNYVLVIPSGIISDQICRLVAGTKTIVTPMDATSGRTGEDRETIARVYAGLGQNPNVASVLLVPGGGAGGTQYPETSTGRLMEQVSMSGKKVEVLRDIGDTMEVIARGVKLAREMVYEASKLRCKPCSDSHLCIGVKCGNSDPTSGIAGNPVVGYVYDKLVDAGGTALFGETTEIIGAEHILAKRAVNEGVAREILRAAKEIEERAKTTGQDIRTMNPVPANIKAGITTLEEKSLGAIHKAGAKPIQGVLKYAEHPWGCGLYFMDNWAWTLSIFMGYAAAGAQMVLYQLGGGGLEGDSVFYQTGSSVAPLIWCSANPRTRAMGGWNLDFYSGTVIEGEETIAEVGERLYAMLLDTASGTKTRTETLNYVDPNEVYTRGPVF